MSLIFSPEAVADLKRLRAFIATSEPLYAQREAQKLLNGLKKIKSFPAIGKPVGTFLKTDAIRDLVVGPYIARYQISDDDQIILRIWHQREQKPK